MMAVLKMGNILFDMCRSEIGRECDSSVDDRKLLVVLAVVVRKLFVMTFWCACVYIS